MKITDFISPKEFARAHRGEGLTAETMTRLQQEIVPYHLAMAEAGVPTKECAEATAVLMILQHALDSKYKLIQVQ